MVIPVGGPRSSQNANLQAVILSPDDLLPQGPGRWTREAVGEAWAQCRRSLRAALTDPEVRTVAILVGVPGSGKSSWSREHDQPGLVIFDACWTEPGRRAAVARQIRAAGRAAVAVWIRTPMDVCRDRNADRPPWRKVPDVALTRAYLAIRERPPTLAEGWTRVLVQDGQAARLDAQDPETALERLGRAPAQQAMALLRARVLPAYRAAQASQVGQGAETPPARLARALEGVGRALERGAAGDARVGQQLARLGTRVQRRERDRWTELVRAELGPDGKAWKPDGHDDLVDDWAEQVGGEIAEIRQRIQPGLTELVGEAWRKGWTAADLEANVVEHGVPLEGGGTAEGQGSVLGRGAHQQLANGLVRAHQEAVGAEWYEWGPTESDNPDPEHAALRGKRFRWSDPPPGGHPGKRRNCRCSAIPILDPETIERLQASLT